MPTSTAVTTTEAIVNLTFERFGELMTSLLPVLYIFIGIALFLFGWGLLVRTWRWGLTSFIRRKK